MGLFEPQHLLIVLAIALIIFGPGKIGDLGGSLGRGIRDFKKAMAAPTSQPPQASAQEAQPTSLQANRPEHAVNVTATAHKGNGLVRKWRFPAAGPRSTPQAHRHVPLARLTASRTATL